MKQLTGKVITSSTPQAATVEIVRRWAHPVYKKTITRRKKYLTHCLIKVDPATKLLFRNANLSAKENAGS